MQPVSTDSSKKEANIVYLEQKKAILAVRSKKKAKMDDSDEKEVILADLEENKVIFTTFFITKSYGAWPDLSQVHSTELTILLLSYAKYSWK